MCVRVQAYVYDISALLNLKLVLHKPFEYFRKHVSSTFICFCVNNKFPNFLFLKLNTSLLSSRYQVPVQHHINSLIGPRFVFFNPLIPLHRPGSYFQASVFDKRKRKQHQLISRCFSESPLQNFVAFFPVFIFAFLLSGISTARSNTVFCSVSVIHE